MSIRLTGRAFSTCFLDPWFLAFHARLNNHRAFSTVSDVVFQVGYIDVGCCMDSDAGSYRHGIAPHFIYQVPYVSS